ncbi:ABC transporter permease [Proteiniclasticum sp. C24MP]|uniref:ABC transporter permease n=1 Tax=Proteiniclasticum sp. C24MP TaxID=3374101 RepID=UPI0037540340
MKLLHTFLRDLKVSYRTYYIYIEFIMALVIVAVLVFVVPENADPTSKLFLHVESGINSEMILDSMEKDQSTEITLLGSREEVVLAMEKDRSAQGAVISETSEGMGYEIILQGYESEEIRNMMESVLLAGFKTEHPEYTETTTVKVLEEDAERLSDRTNYMPILLMMNSAFMGLFIVAAYVFMDKEEGTIRALTVTPVSIRDYLLSKVGVMLFTGLLTGLITTVLVVGMKVNYLHLILVLAASNFFGTALGLFIASFYDSIIKSMGALYIIIMIMAFGGISYFMPSFSPLIIRILPSYPLLFAFREVFLERPDTAFILTTSGLFILAGAVFFMAAVLRYKKTLTV